MCNNKVNTSGAKTGTFGERGGFLEWRHFDKGFVDNIQKNDSAG